MTTTTQTYRGAETCDFRPQWSDADPELVALLESCHAADPDELTPQLVLADWLAERGDPREAWVRVGCELWAACRDLEPGPDDWNYDAVKAALGPVCKTLPGWRLAGLWGALVAWHAPSGGDGGPMGRTWVDARVHVVNRCVWWWSLGFLESGQAYAAGSQADAAGSQADAAGSQADAAGRQADAAGRQASAAGSQADAAGSQASAAGSQADAAGSQASATWSQASATWSQASAAGSQASAAGKQERVWRFARAAWELCLAKLPLLESAGFPGRGA